MLVVMFLYIGKNLWKFLHYNHYQYQTLSIMINSCEEKVRTHELAMSTGNNTFPLLKIRVYSVCAHAVVFSKIPSYVHIWMYTNIFHYLLAYFNCCSLSNFRGHLVLLKSILLCVQSFSSI